MKQIQIKRIYEQPLAEDGYRMLVDRLWPRGIKKEVAKLDEWNKNLPPSVELRKWFDHKPERFKEFESKYRLELTKIKDELNRVRDITKHSNLTLLYGAKDPHINHAIVLLNVLMKNRNRVLK